jgi:hypothetical protein
VPFSRRHALRRVEGQPAEGDLLPPTLAAKLDAWIAEREAQPDDLILVNSIGVRWSRTDAGTGDAAARGARIVLSRVGSRLRAHVVGASAVERTRRRDGDNPVS